MKTSTILKRAIETISFLMILLVLFSFKNENPVTAYSEDNCLEISFNEGICINPIDKPLFLKMAAISKDAEVLLTIDTENINENNLNTTVVFSNVGETESGGSGDPSNFLTTVYQKMKITWRGVPKDQNSTAVIEVTDVERKIDGGAKLLRFSTKEYKNKALEMKIKGRYIEGTEYYNVKFRITDGNSVREFEIDPKLEMGG